MPEKLSKEEFIEKARSVHHDFYDYSEVNYINIDTKVKIICPKHGAFLQTPYHHKNRGQGCPECKKESIGNSHRRDIDDFISQASALHNNKYDYSRINYIDNKTKIEIICPIHGPFWQAPQDHNSKRALQGCPLCSRYRKPSTEEFINKANLIHNNKYDYSNVKYTNNRTKVKIICHEHGEFLQTPNSHLLGQGCPKCGKIKSITPEKIKKVIETKRRNGTFNTSKPEDQLELKLKKHFINVYRNYNADTRYPFCCDFYIPERDLFMEYNGFWSHGGHWYNKRSQTDISKRKEYEEKYADWCPFAWWTNDVLKRKTATKNNLNYVVLWNEQDIEDWFAIGCPDGQDWKKEYSWKLEKRNK